MASKDDASKSTDKRSSWVLTFLAEHPAIVGTIAYVYVAILGSTFNWFYLRGFGINYFDFADAGDYLTGALSEPLVLFQGLLAIAAIGGIFHKFTIDEMQALWAGRPTSWRGKRWRMRLWRVMLLMLFVGFPVFYTFGPGFVMARVDEAAVRHGWGSYARISLVQHDDTQLADAMSKGEVMLLGTSQRFAFLYDRAAKASWIVPTDNVTSLRVCRVSVPAIAWPPWRLPVGQPCRP